jgi:antitoxin HicB
MSQVLEYPANFELDEEYFVVTFPDLPEAITQGMGEEEALAMAAEVLESALDFYFEDNRPVPPPSEAMPGQRMIPVPPDVSAKVLLWNQRINRLTQLNAPQTIYPV